MATDKGNTPPYSDEELAGIIGNQIDSAGNFASDFMEENRRQAWNYYLGRRQDGQGQKAAPQGARGRGKGPQDRPEQPRA